MSFYQSISEHYEQIFPLNKIQIEFIKKSLHNFANSSVLDIGCGTGNLSLELAKLFSQVTAIDLDEAMLKRAIIKNVNGVEFLKMNMLDIEKTFSQNAFDAVICFGNTLVHLNGTNEILDFFKQAKNILKEDGKLLFQMINYDRIIDHKVQGLPTIENEQIKFERNYTYKIEQNRVDFETILTVKNTGQLIQNTIVLYPLRKDEILKHLKVAGFEDVQFYGNFKSDTFAIDSIPLVVKAS